MSSPITPSEIIPTTGCEVLKFPIDDSGNILPEAIGAGLQNGELTAPVAVTSIGCLGSCACGRSFLVKAGAPRDIPQGCPALASLNTR